MLSIDFFSPVNSVTIVTLHADQDGLEEDREPLPVEELTQKNDPTESSSKKSFDAEGPSSHDPTWTGV